MSVSARGDGFAELRQLGLDAGDHRPVESPIQVIIVVRAWLAERGKRTHLGSAQLAVARTAAEQLLRALEVEPGRTDEDDVEPLELSP